MSDDNSINVTNDDEKKLMTIGWIKSIDLSAKTFTIEPVSAYRFQIDEKDDNSWKIIFKEFFEVSFANETYSSGIFFLCCS